MQTHSVATIPAACVTVDSVTHLVWSLVAHALVGDVQSNGCNLHEFPPRTATKLTACHKNRDGVHSVSSAGQGPIGS